MMVPDGADFSQYPQSLSEARANRSKKAADWTARDALVDMLRRIDKGEIAPTTLVICVGVAEAGGSSTHYSNFGPDLYHSLGLLERVKHLLQEAG